MELRQLRHLVAALEAASISQAARGLGVAQPSLSQSLRGLEEELGVALLERTPQGVRPTAAGRLAAERARAILDLAEELRLEWRGAPGEAAGEVRVGLPTTMALHLTLPLVRAVRESLPKVRLRVSEGMSGHILEWLTSGRLDLAVLSSDEPVEGVALSRVADEDLCLIARAGEGASQEEIGFAELAAFPLALPGPDHGLRRAIETVRRSLEVRLDIVVEIDSLPHLKRLAIEGDACAILPRAACQDEIAQGRVVARPIVRPRLTRPIVLARPGGAPPSPAVRRVLELLTQQVRASLLASRQAP